MAFRQSGIWVVFALIGGALGLIGFGSFDASAQGKLLEQYQARLSPQDHRNSNGDRLSTVAAILRQDRANFHRFEQPDPEDQGDATFVTPEERARFEQLISRGLVRTEDRRAILGGTPLVEVSVYSLRVDVVILEP